MSSTGNGVIAVNGGSRMGAGIAQVFATVGYDVVVARGELGRKSGEGFFASPGDR